MGTDGNGTVVGVVVVVIVVVVVDVVVAILAVLVWLYEMCNVSPDWSK